MPSAALDAIIAENFSSTSSGDTAGFTAKTLTVNSSKTFTINSGHTVTVAGAITNINGTFNLENNANLVQTNTTAVTNSGSIVVKRNSANIQLYDYTLWSSPVTGQKLKAFSPHTLDARFYSYNSGTNFYNVVADPTNTNFATATGYLIRAPNTWAASTPTTFNGTFTVRALPQYLYTGIDTYGDLLFNVNIPVANQVLYAKTASNVLRTAATGTLAITQTCTWVTAANIEDWLGIGTATAADAAFLTVCAAAASQFCWRRRMEAGYVDSLTTVPSQDVFLGTQMYGGALYRQRGSVDQFASFQNMGVTPVMGLNGMIRQLLGIDRPQVA